MPKSTPQQPGGVQALDWNSILQKLQALGELAPVIYQVVLQIVEALNKPSPVMARGAAAGGGDHCPHDHLHECCHKVIEHQAAALALAIHCCHCCDPDQGE